MKSDLKSDGRAGSRPVVVLSAEPAQGNDDVEVDHNVEYCACSYGSSYYAILACAIAEEGALLLGPVRRVREDARAWPNRLGVDRHERRRHPALTGLAQADVESRLADIVLEE